MVDALPVHQFNLADALADAGRFAEALGCYRRGLELEPANCAAHVQAGRMAAKLQRYAEAARHFREAVARDPLNAELQTELGCSLTMCQQLDEAVRHLERAVELQPTSATALDALGAAYLDDQSYEAAEQCFRRAIESHPNCLSAQLHLARVLTIRDKLSEAAEAYERAVQIDGRSSEAILQAAMARRRLGQLDAAANWLHKALELAPTDANALNLLGVVLDELGRPADALDCFDDAIQFAPHNAEAHVNRALGLLQSGRLSEGWAEYEWRWRCADAGSSAVTATLPQWDGSPLSNKTLLVLAEQGLADELMFASCYADAIERARLCVITCDPRLETLLRRSFPKAQIIPTPRGASAASERAHFHRSTFKLRPEVYPVISELLSNVFQLARRIWFPKQRASLERGNNW